MSSNSNGLRERSPNFVRKLHFRCDPVEPPLHGQSFYLDIRSTNLKSRIIHRISELGGRIENFLSKDLQGLITDRSPSKSAEAPYGSAVTTLQKNSIPLSRGQALLLKAAKHQTHENVQSTDLLQNAVAMGVKTHTAKDFIRHSTRLLAMFKSQKKNQQRKGPLFEVPSASMEKEKENAIIVKVEDCNSLYKPLFKKFEKFPKVAYNEFGCPFDEGIVLCKQNSENQFKVRKKHSANAVNGGYCEACDHWYKCELKDHLKSNKHLSYISSLRNFKSLDAMTGSLSNIDILLGKLASKCDAKKSKECNYKITTKKASVVEVGRGNEQVTMNYFETKRKANKDEPVEKINWKSDNVQADSDDNGYISDIHIDDRKQNGFVENKEKHEVEINFESGKEENDDFKKKSVEGNVIERTSDMDVMANTKMQVSNNEVQNDIEWNGAIVTCDEVVDTANIDTKTEAVKSVFPLKDVMEVNFEKNTGKVAEKHHRNTNEHSDSVVMEKTMGVDICNVCDMEPNEQSNSCEILCHDIEEETVHSKNFKVLAANQLVQLDKNNVNEKLPDTRHEHKMSTSNTNEMSIDCSEVGQELIHGDSISQVSKKFERCDTFEFPNALVQSGMELGKEICLQDTDLNAEKEGAEDTKCSETMKSQCSVSMPICNLKYDYNREHTYNLEKQKLSAMETDDKCENGDSVQDCLELFGKDWNVQSETNNGQDFFNMEQEVTVNYSEVKVTACKDDLRKVLNDMNDATFSSECSFGDNGVSNVISYLQSSDSEEQTQNCADILFTDANTTTEPDHTYENERDSSGCAYHEGISHAARNRIEVSSIEENKQNLTDNSKHGVTNQSVGLEINISSPEVLQSVMTEDETILAHVSKIDHGTPLLCHGEMVPVQQKVDDRFSELWAENNLTVDFEEITQVYDTVISQEKIGSNVDTVEAKDHSTSPIKNWLLSKVDTDELSADINEDHSQDNGVDIVKNLNTKSSSPTFVIKNYETEMKMSESSSATNSINSTKNYVSNWIQQQPFDLYDEEKWLENSHKHIDLPLLTDDEENVNKVCTSGNKIETKDIDENIFYNSEQKDELTGQSESETNYEFTEKTVPGVDHNKLCDSEQKAELHEQSESETNCEFTEKTVPNVDQDKLSDCCTSISDCTLENFVVNRMDTNTHSNIVTASSAEAKDRDILTSNLHDEVKQELDCNSVKSELSSCLTENGIKITGLQSLRFLHRSHSNGGSSTINYSLLNETNSVDDKLPSIDASSNCKHEPHNKAAMDTHTTPIKQMIIAGNEHVPISTSALHTEGSMAQTPCASPLNENVLCPTTWTKMKGSHHLMQSHSHMFGNSIYSPISQPSDDLSSDHNNNINNKDANGSYFTQLSTNPLLLQGQHSPTPYSNPQCYTQPTASGWYMQALQGDSNHGDQLDYFNTGILPGNNPYGYETESNTQDSFKYLQTNGHSNITDYLLSPCKDKGLSYHPVSPNAANNTHHMQFLMHQPEFDQSCMHTNVHELTSQRQFQSYSDHSEELVLSRPSNGSQFDFLSPTSNFLKSNQQARSRKVSVSLWESAEYQGGNQLFSTTSRCNYQDGSSFPVRNLPTIRIEDIAEDPSNDCAQKNNELEDRINHKKVQKIRMTDVHQKYPSVLGYGKYGGNQLVGPDLADYNCEMLGNSQKQGIITSEFKGFQQHIDELNEQTNHEAMDIGFENGSANGIHVKPTAVSFKHEISSSPGDACSLNVDSHVNCGKAETNAVSSGSMKQDQIQSLGVGFEGDDENPSLLSHQKKSVAESLFRDKGYSTFHNILANKSDIDVCSEEAALDHEKHNVCRNGDSSRLFLNIMHEPASGYPCSQKYVSNSTDLNEQYRCENQSGAVDGHKVCAKRQEIQYDHDTQTELESTPGGALRDCGTKLTVQVQSDELDIIDSVQTVDENFQTLVHAQQREKQRNTVHSFEEHQETTVESILEESVCPNEPFVDVCNINSDDDETENGMRASKWTKFAIEEMKKSQDHSAAVGRKSESHLSNWSVKEAGDCRLVFKINNVDKAKNLARSQRKRKMQGSTPKQRRAQCQEMSSPASDSQAEPRSKRPKYFMYC